MSTPDELCAESRQCLSKKNFKEAISLLEQAIELDSSHTAAHESLAGLCFLTGDYDRAAKLYYRTSILDPKNTAALVNLGAVHNKQKKYQEAVKILRQALSRDRRCSEAYYNLGIAQRGLNQLAMAVSAYKEAIRLNPDMAEAYSNLGNCLLEMKNHSQAILNYRRAIELRPGFKKAVNGLRRAEDDAIRVKENRSPFGRLVDMEEVERQNKVTEQKLVLTPQQRYDDRDTVHRLAKESQITANEFLEHLKSELEKVILETSRLATEERQGRVWAALLEQLQTAIANYKLHSGHLEKKTDLIREHEANLQKTFANNQESTAS